MKLNGKIMLLHALQTGGNVRQINTRVNFTKSYCNLKKRKISFIVGFWLMAKLSINLLMKYKLIATQKLCKYVLVKLLSSIFLWVCGQLDMCFDVSSQSEILKIKNSIFSKGFLKKIVISLKEKKERKVQRNLFFVCLLNKDDWRQKLNRTFSKEKVVAVDEWVSSVAFLKISLLNFFWKILNIRFILYKAV